MTRSGAALRAKKEHCRRSSLELLADPFNGVRSIRMSWEAARGGPAAPPRAVPRTTKSDTRLIVGLDGCLPGRQLPSGFQWSRPKCAMPWAP